MSVYRLPFNGVMAGFINSSTSPLLDSPTTSNSQNPSVGAKHLGDNLSRETEILNPNASPCDDTAINPDPPQPDRAKHSEYNISSNPKIDRPNASPLQIEREIESDNIKTIEQNLRQLARRSLLEEERDVNRVRWFKFQPFIQEYAKYKAGDLTAAHQQAINYYLTTVKAQPWQTKDDLKEYLEIFYHYCEVKQYIAAFDNLRLCHDFLRLQGHNNIRVELYGKLVRDWNLSKSEWQFPASLTSLGNAYKSLGQYQLAIQYHLESQAICEEIGDRNGIAISLNNLGSAYYSLGQYQLAIQYYLESKAIKEEIGDRHGIANSLGNLGNAYYSLGQYQLAIEYYLESQAICEEIGDRNGIASSLIGLGSAYYSLGQYQQAIQYYLESKAIFEEIGDRRGVANSLGNLGLAYDSLGQYQLAIEYYLESKAIFEEIGDRNGIASSLNNLGNAYNSLGQYQLAIQYHLESKAIKEEIGDRQGIADSLQNLANAYYNCGKVREGFLAGDQAYLILQELKLPLDAMPYPKWLKSVIKFAQRGKLQIAFCFIIGLFAFPFALTWIVALIMWRVIRALVRR